MASQQNRAHTIDSTQFDPEILFTAWENGQKTLPENNELRSSIITTFDLPPSDDYIYHATASVTLAQVQMAINHGARSGLHSWYLSEEGTPLPSPSQDDILAYVSVFGSATSTSRVLNGFAANAKKGSIRAKVASHLQAQRTLPSHMAIPKSKKHINLYYDFWYWSCLNLEWAGPEGATAKIKTSHHILPVFMHHFGCVVPSYESLQIIKKVARERSVVEIGSGNGYWAYMLRRLGVSVQAVDNLESEYRTLWISDTITGDGEKFLTSNNGSKDAVLLLVYPVVSSGFTAKILKAYQGDVVCVAGTQNRNGYTAFKDRTIDDYVSTEMKDFQRIIQIPLPSFAGKDEALFVFERRRQEKT